MKIPVVLNIGDKVVIFGGGKVAIRKVEYLSKFTKNISVIAEKANTLPKHVEFIKASITSKNILKFIPKNTALVIAALSDSNINHEIAKWCNNHNILVNVVDDIEPSNVLFPALSKNNDLNISISTSGKCPFLSRKLREDIDLWIEEKSRWLEILSPIREKLVGMDKKNQVLSKIYDNPEIQKLVKAGDIENALKKAWEVFNVYR
ncbi:MAG: bifunctional precorrin-2 dehydrogenase/sirohydrochlorin ferrochelatase [Thermoplasmatales archaeon]|nr:MAG: bifunctional precorrin-2 dehydrogenase/sirohydrochlorin ferrochelatase [Thermoplasmatales archaeon]